MVATTQKSLSERLKDPNVKNIDPHKVARELIKLHSQDNKEAVQKLRASYIEGLVLQGLTKPKAVKIVENNLMYAAKLADTVAGCGYEASGQLLSTFERPLESGGPVAKFYKSTVNK